MGRNVRVEMKLAWGISPFQGLGILVGFVVPGRCPGLSHYAPLGRKTGAPFGCNQIVRTTNNQRTITNDSMKPPCCGELGLGEAEAVSCG
jgi:hypothetical protein